MIADCFQSLKGFDFLQTLPHPPAVIVTTAYHQYAVRGFDLNVTDYLLKPFPFERFLIAVNKVKGIPPQADNIEDKEETRNFIFLNIRKKKVRIYFSEILYIESQREYVKIVTQDKEHLTKMSTHEIERLLPPDQFCRAHRSFIVSIPKIESYTSDSLEIQGVMIPVGREYKGVLQRL